MIKSENVCAKKSIPLLDRINMINELVTGYFVDGKYTPYYKEINDIVVFFKYCVDGVEFSEDESIYKSVVEDKELLEIYNSQNMNRTQTFKKQLEDIYNIVEDMVEFEKQRMIHSSTAIDEKILEILNKESRNKDVELKALEEVNRVQKEQARQLEYANKISEMMTPEETVELNRLIIKSGEYNPNDVAKIVTDRYLESCEHIDNVQSVINAKNEKIKDLETYKKMYDARNVLTKK